MKVREILVLLALATAVRGAEPVNEGLVREMERLRDAALRSDYALNQVAWLANGIGPRLSGSRGAAAAVEYVAGEMERQGFRVRRESVRVPHWVRGVESGALVDWPGRPAGLTQELKLTALGGSVGTDRRGLTARVTVVETFDELERLPRERVAGTIVLYSGRLDPRMAAQGRGGDAYSHAVAYRTKGAIEAAKKGALASLVRSVGHDDYRLVHTGVMHYAEGVQKIPHAAVSSEDADLIAWHAKRGTAVVRMTLGCRTEPDAPSHNVVADLVGSERPDEIVLVSGHLDSWDLGTGAIDDAAGVAMGMGTLHLVRSLGLKPKRTLRLVAWMNEENGGAGAKGYLKDHAAELGKHVAAIESDLGCGHPMGHIVNVTDAGMDYLKPVSKLLWGFGAGLLERQPHPVGSDLGGLGEAGVPTMSVMQDERSYFAYHHTPADTFDKVGPRELAENTAAMAVLAYCLAGTAQPLPRVPAK